MQSDNSPKQTRRRRRWGKLMLALGLLAVLLAIVIAAQRLAFLAHAQSAQGIVVEMVSMSSGRIGHGYASAPRVRFVVGGVEHEFASPIGSYPPAFAVGETVRVLYDPVDPDHAEVDNLGQLWGPVTICGVLGLLLSVLGGWLLRTPRAAKIATRSEARK